MAVYVGILSNRGKVIESDADALAYAFEMCGIEPSENYGMTNADFKKCLLEWFYSDDWVRYRSTEEYIADEKCAFDE